ncbi:acyl-CoA dehydrogenase family protein [Zooshikella harenae]|uniref:Acyl-CoA/acyl-ACP dehydrogenase n=1 Tax=Zooshikella harenae TaxID=2827238 RepID=A0ABS5ZCR6_9GAMM|nr:acyl-CoA dehydrogenase family protein [Zooshikella harenae]MBU2711760.1 acyl-CoA/acyl-ACP dehydrogenase [Zooshikella harenae]
MDFTLTLEQKTRCQHIESFAKEVLSKSQNAHLVSQKFNRDGWLQASEFGLAGLPIPEQWGGSALGALDTMLAIESLGRGCSDMGLVFSLCAHMFACAIPIWRHGTDEQKNKYLAKIASGQLIVANAITEPSSGSDAYSMKSFARKEKDYYILNGSKCFITNAPIADLMLVYAKTKQGQGYFNSSAFLIPKDMPGIEITTESAKTGLVTSPWGSVHFNECLIPSHSRIGEEGAGSPIFHDSMIWERGCLFAAYVGAMERVLQQCIEYSIERKQYDQSIGRNQSISNRLVDFKLRLETSRLLLYKAGWLYDNNKPYEEAIAQSKLWISESAVQCGLDAIQIFGGLGVCSELGIDRLLLDALPSRIFSGTSEIQREFISRSMGLRS